MHKNYRKDERVVYLIRQLRKLEREALKRKEIFLALYPKMFKIFEGLEEKME